MLVEACPETHLLLSTGLSPLLLAKIKNRARLPDRAKDLVTFLILAAGYRLYPWRSLPLTTLFYHNHKLHKMKPYLFCKAFHNVHKAVRTLIFGDALLH